MTKATGKKATIRTLKPTKPSLRGRMAAIRKELSGLNGGASADLFAETLEQLDALGDEIAIATDRLMTACETIQDATDGITAKTKERGTKNRLKTINQATGDIFEACSFQDLTGQRLGKITRTVAVIEDGVREVSTQAGVKANVKGRKKGKAGKHAIDRIDGGIVLEGPQINGPAVSQADIDSLFD
ncbi:MAG: protein phosphatase CheZ [Rhodospirillales bacterium]|nr:protein phosphatase CheZ [Rhodospirillales bacterium]